MIASTLLLAALSLPDPGSLNLDCRNAEGRLLFTVEEGNAKNDSAILRFAGGSSSTVHFSARVERFPDRGIMDLEFTRTYDHPYFGIRISGLASSSPYPRFPKRPSMYRGGIQREQGSHEAITCHPRATGF